MKKVQRTLAAALAAMMLMALAGCSKGDVTKEVNSGLSDLKAQAAEPAVEPQTETPAEPKTDAASEPASEPAAEPEPEATAEPAPASAPAGAWWPWRRPDAAPTVDASVTTPMAPSSTMALPKAGTGSPRRPRCQTEPAPITT